MLAGHAGRRPSKGWEWVGGSRGAPRACGTRRARAGAAGRTRRHVRPRPARLPAHRPTASASPPPSARVCSVQPRPPSPRPCPASAAQPAPRPTPAAAARRRCGGGRGRAPDRPSAAKAPPRRRTARPRAAMHVARSTGDRRRACRAPRLPLRARAPAQRGGGRACVSAMPSPDCMALAMPTSEILALSVLVSSTLALLTSRCRICAGRARAVGARPHPVGEPPRGAPS